MRSPLHMPEWYEIKERLHKSNNGVSPMWDWYIGECMVLMHNINNGMKEHTLPLSKIQCQPNFDTLEEVVDCQVMKQDSKGPKFRVDL